MYFGRYCIRTPVLEALLLLGILACWISPGKNATSPALPQAWILFLLKYSASKLEILNKKWSSVDLFSIFQKLQFEKSVLTNLIDNSNRNPFWIFSGLRFFRCYSLFQRIFSSSFGCPKLGNCLAHFCVSSEKNLHNFTYGFVHCLLYSTKFRCRSAFDALETKKSTKYSKIRENCKKN